jgi:hypothetical protein
MTTMNKRLFLISHIILGLLLILNILYTRFFLVRLPKDLHFIFSDIINYKLLYIVILGIVLSFSILIANILLLLNYTPKKSFWSNFAEKISELITNAFYSVYSLLEYIVKDGYDKLSYISQKFYKYFSPFSETFFLFFLYSIRFIILICFLIDIFFFFRLNYFYISLNLLSISLCIRLLFFILEETASNLNDIQSFLNITPLGIDEETNLPITKYSLKEDYKNHNLNYFISQYILCNKLSGYLENYHKYSRFFSPRINIFIYSLYLFGWSYILIINVYF